MADRARSRLPVLAMLLALAGGAFWWYDGLVLLEPLLGGSGLDLAALRSAKAGSRERAASDERPERSPASTPDGPAADADDPTGDLDLLARFGSWTGERLSRQVFLPSRPRLDDDDLAALGLPPSDAAGEAAGPSGRAGPPPEHLVSVVMIADREHLAVVDGAVVAVGDRLEAGEVVEIHDEGLVVNTGEALVEYVIGVPRSQELRGVTPVAPAREDGP